MEASSYEVTVYGVLATQLDRNTDLEALVKRLWTRIEDLNMLLQSALLELHDATAPTSDASRFVSDWHRSKGVRL